MSQSFQANNVIPLFLWRNESLTLRNVGWSLQGRVGPRAAVTSVSREEGAAAGATEVFISGAEVGI